MNLILKAKIVERFGTQCDFAVAANEDETFVSRVVRGRRILADERKESWAKTLGVGVGQIFPIEDQRDEQ